MTSLLPVHFSVTQKLESINTQTQFLNTTETLLFNKAINAWAVDLYQDLSRIRNLQDKNFIFFTPNLLASFSILYAGAPEKLRGIMEKALHIGELKQNLWHNSFKNWSEGIMARSQELEEGKPLFHFQQIQMLASHVSAPLTAKAAESLNYYNCEQKSFSDPAAVGPFINSRVEEFTEGIIKDLVGEEDLSEDLILLVASAALFKGQWKYPFDKGRNSIETFINSDGSMSQVEMMNQGVDNLKVAYDSTSDYEIALLELPFHGQISLLLMKSNEWDARKPKDQLQKFMTKENIQNLLDNFDERFQAESALSIGIPKLDLDEKVDILNELGHTLLAQAIKDADFKGSLVDCKYRAETPKMVSEVHFTMDEEGAKIAGASYSPTYMESCDPEFKLDRPFGMAIIDRSNQTILSMGQVLKLESMQK
jgi:serine protease inhibitor